MSFFQTKPEVDPYLKWIERLDDAVRELRHAYDERDVQALEQWASICAFLGQNLTADIGLLGRNGFAATPDRDKGRAPMRAVIEMDASGTQVSIRVEGTELGPHDQLFLGVQEIPDGLTTIQWPRTIMIRRADGREERCPIERARARGSDTAGSTAPV